MEMEKLSRKTRKSKKNEKYEIANNTQNKDLLKKNMIKRKYVVQHIIIQ